MAVTALSGQRWQGVGFASSLGSGADATNISDPTSVASGETNGVATPSGLGLKSLYFDGDDAMDIDGALSFSTTVGTISVWWYNDGSTNDEMILVFGDTGSASYLGFETKTGGLKVAFRAISGTQWEIRRATGGTNGGTLSVGWHNMVVSQNGTAVAVYVDGVLLTNFDGTPADKSKWVESNLDNGRIGCDSISGNGNDHFFTGNLMEIGLWNTALPIGDDKDTADSVKWLWNDGDGRLASTIPTGLRAYYSGNSSPATNDAVSDKTTVTDVPAGSEFEQTDNYKSYQFSDGGYDSGLGSDGNWTTVTSLTNNDSVTTPSGLNSAGITKSWLSDGANTIISTSTGQLIPVDSDITFVAWVYSDVIETQCIFNSNANNYFVVYLANNGDRLEFKVQDGDGESSGGEADFPFAVDTWYMIACTFNASTGQTISYVFDTSDDSKTEVKDSGPDPIRSVATNTAWKMIGGGTETFNGRVLSPCIWNVILSSSDLDDLFDSGDGAVMNTVQKDKIVCYWDSQTGTNGTPISNLAVGKKWTERGTAI